MAVSLYVWCYLLLPCCQCLPSVSSSVGQKRDKATLATASCAAAAATVVLAGSNTGAYNTESSSVSFFFSQGGHAECARILLEGGCDTNLVNDMGITGWELANSVRLSVRGAASAHACFS